MDDTRMKTKEKVLWLAVLAALAANIWLPRHLQQKYSWERDLSQRYAADFDKSAAEVKDYIRKYIPDVTDAQIEEWTSAGSWSPCRSAGRPDISTTQVRTCSG